jgi:hypothetical protein
MATGTYEYQSDFARRYYGKGVAAGKVEGKAEGEATAILTVLRTRGLQVPAAVRERIMSCADTDELSRLLERAVTVGSADDLFT